MIGTKRLRMLGTRKAGIGLAGLLTAGLALASGTAFASTSSSVEHVGDDLGELLDEPPGVHQGLLRRAHGPLLLQQELQLQAAAGRAASSKCEGGTNYTQTPASTFDPLYVIVPLGFTPPKWTLQCPAGTCIDHPHTIDLTSVLGSGTGNLTLPAHSHIVATSNSHQSEWWNVDIVGVKSMRRLGQADPVEERPRAAVPAAAQSST